MSKTIIKTKTWRCSCGYSQDFEPTQENQDVHFNNDMQFKLSDMKENECPSCKLRGLKGAMIRETNFDKKITLIVMGEEDIETEIENEDEERIRMRKNKRTEAEKISYRSKRKKDIQEAIVEAKKLED